MVKLAGLIVFMALANVTDLVWMVKGDPRRWRPAYIMPTINASVWTWLVLKLLIT
jgi:hypothetical protein